MLDKIITAFIIIMYNMFVHHLTSTMYKKLPYDEKHSKSTALLFISGIIGIVFGETFFENITIKKSLSYGGFILVITAIISNWSLLTDELKLIVIGGFLLGLLWFAHKKLK